MAASRATRKPQPCTPAMLSNLWNSAGQSNVRCKCAAAVFARPRILSRYYPPSLGPADALLLFRLSRLCVPASPRVSCGRLHGHRNFWKEKKKRGPTGTWPCTRVLGLVQGPNGGSSWSPVFRSRSCLSCTLCSCLQPANH